MLHLLGFNPTLPLPLLQSAKVTGEGERNVFSLLSEFTLCLPTLLPTRDLRKPTFTLVQHQLLFGERLSSWLQASCAVLCHAIVYFPHCWHHLYCAGHSYNNNHQMGCAPCSFSSFQYLPSPFQDPPLKRMLHLLGRKPTLLSDVLTLHKSAKVTGEGKRSVSSYSPATQGLDEEAGAKRPQYFIGSHNKIKLGNTCLIKPMDSPHSNWAIKLVHIEGPVLCHGLVTLCGQHFCSRCFLQRRYRSSWSQLTHNSWI